jgi:hypothetical protein
VARCYATDTIWRASKDLERAVGREP